MIRITVVPREHSATRVIVEGRINKASSVELAGVCDRHLAGGDNIELDLSAVTFADSEGVTLVRDLIKRGCTLEECSELVRTLVEDHSPQQPKSNYAGNENERELLAQLRAGDEDAFGLVVQRYGGRMLADCAQISQQRTRRSGCRPGGVRFGLPRARQIQRRRDAFYLASSHCRERVARAVAIQAPPE